MKPVWFYEDFRACLADWVEERRAQGQPVSNRYVAQKMGINSTSWLTAVLKGDKGLSDETASRLASVMRLDESESRFFVVLAHYSQAKTTEERNRLFRELTAMRQSRSVRLIADDQYEYYGQWHHSVIRALIGAFGFDGDYETLAARCVPHVSAAQARTSVALLEKLGFVVRDGDVWKLAESAVKAAHPRREAVENFQRETMRLAMEAIDRFNPARRDLGTVTVGVSAETAQRIRDLMAETKRKIVELANADESADSVWQINFQVFPLSKTVTRDTDHS